MGCWNRRYGSQTKEKMRDYEKARADAESHSLTRCVCALCVCVCLGQRAVYGCGLTGIPVYNVNNNVSQQSKRAQTHEQTSCMNIHMHCDTMAVALLCSTEPSVFRLIQLLLSL